MTLPIKQLSMNKITYDLLRQDASDYLMVNQGATLSTFLNDLPLLPNQSFSVTSNRPRPPFYPHNRRAIHLSIESVDAYLTFLSYLSYQVPPQVTQEYAISAFLEHLAIGIVSPSTYPTSINQSSTYSKVSLSSEGINGLLRKSLTPTFEGISDYLALLAYYNVFMLDTKPDTLSITTKSGWEFNIPGYHPEAFNRGQQIALKIPQAYLLSIASTYNIRALRAQTEVAICASVIEYIGLGWLTPDADISLLRQEET